MNWMRKRGNHVIVLSGLLINVVVVFDGIVND